MNEKPLMRGYGDCRKHGPYLVKIHKNGCPKCHDPDKALRMAGIPKQFIRSSSENFNPMNDGQAKAQPWLKDYFAGISNPATADIYMKKKLILTGISGNGKTHILTKIVGKAILMRLEAIYIKEGEMCSKIWQERQAAEFSGKKTILLYDEIVRKKICAIDEFGMTIGNKGNLEIVDTLIRDRYDCGLGFFLATNMNISGLEEIISVPLYDRIFDDAAVIEFNGPSLRKKPTIL